MDDEARARGPGAVASEMPQMCTCPLGMHRCIVTQSAQDVALGAILGLALSVNLPVAKLLGATLPILIQRFGVDPAVASGPFITTLTDVASMLTYFSIAAYVLTHFALVG